MKTETGWSSGRLRSTSILVIVGTILGLVLVVVVQEVAPRFSEPSDATAAQAVEAIELNVPGAVTPTTYRPDEVRLPEEIDVVGVRVGEFSRAYVLPSLESLDYHIINDVIGGMPVTITYCDLAGRVRVVADPEATEPLEVAIGGRDENMQMVLRYEDTCYAQDAVEFPVPDYPSTRARWGAWLVENPDTDVFIGDLTEFLATP